MNMKWLLAIIFYIFPSMIFANELSSDRQKTLLYLLRQDCGSCHGMTLKGGLGPALLPETLANKPTEFLVQTILDGRPNTAMPPWRGLLTQAEAVWLVAELVKGIPHEH